MMEGLTPHFVSNGSGMSNYRNSPIITTVDSVSQIMAKKKAIPVTGRGGP
jgi:hypothetical protein